MPSDVDPKRIEAVDEFIAQTISAPDRDSRLRVSHVPNSNVIIIRFIDRKILDEANIQHVGDEIVRIIGSHSKPRLIIDFSEVEHLSSAALGTLITINNRIRQAGGQLRVAGVDPEIYEVFKTTQLNKLFEMYEEPEEALRSLTDAVP
ncbi:MAG: STAS domain-containing protein [Phycisphaerales bacterium]|nr:STAS domain-containing protein [Phycisphaerales bacterium]